MITLSYGFQLPQNGDKGSVFFPALAFNIQQLNDHDHDGINSKPLSGSSIATGIITAIDSDWVEDSDGIWSQTKNTPAGYTMDGSSIAARDASGNYIIPTIQRLTNTTFKIIVCDPSLNLTIIFK